MGSPINAATDPTDGLRYYTFNDQRLVSVTSVRKVIGMPFALAGWQVNQVIKASLALRGTAQGMTLPDDQYGKALRSMGMAERDDAAKVGTSVHDAADAGVHSQDLSEDDVRRPFLAQYEAWQRAMDPEVLVSEAQVFSLKHGYAGSLDLIAEIKGHKYLVDLKTGKGVYTDHAVQLALYMGADFIGGFDPYEGMDAMFPEPTQHLMDCESMAVLHLRPDGWQFIEIPYSDALAAASLDMVRLAHFFMDNPTIDTLKGATYP